MNSARLISCGGDPIWDVLKQANLRPCSFHCKGAVEVGIDPRNGNGLHIGIDGDGPLSTSVGKNPYRPMPVSIFKCASATIPRSAAKPFNTTASALRTYRGNDIEIQQYRSSSSRLDVARDIRICSWRKPASRRALASHSSVTANWKMPFSCIPLPGAPRPGRIRPV